MNNKDLKLDLKHWKEKLNEVLGWEYNTKWLNGNMDAAEDSMDVREIWIYKNEECVKKIKVQIPRDFKNIISGMSIYKNII